MSLCALLSVGFRVWHPKEAVDVESDQWGLICANSRLPGGIDVLSECTSAQMSLIKSRTFCRSPTMAIKHLALCVGLLALAGPIALAEHENDMQNLARPSFENNDLPPSRLLIVLLQ